MPPHARCTALMSRRPYVEVAILVGAYTVICGPCRWTWKHTTTDRETAENMADFHSQEAHP